METAFKALEPVKDQFLIILEESQEIAVESVCDILELNEDDEIRKILQDDILRTAVEKKTLPGDLVPLHFLCISYALGWIFSINHKSEDVKREIKLRNYKMACYQTLYKYVEDNSIAL